jgi:hypothetical protein
MPQIVCKKAWECVLDLATSPGRSRVVLGPWSRMLIIVLQLQQGLKKEEGELVCIGYWKKRKVEVWGISSKTPLHRFYNQLLESRLVRGTPYSANFFNFLPRKFPTIEEHLLTSTSQVLRFGYLRFQSIYHVGQLLTFMKNLWFLFFLFFFN